MLSFKIDTSLDFDMLERLRSRPWTCCRFKTFCLNLPFKAGESLWNEKLGGNVAEEKVEEEEKEVKDTMEDKRRDEKAVSRISRTTPAMGWWLMSGVRGDRLGRTIVRANCGCCSR